MTESNVEVFICKLGFSGSKCEKANTCEQNSCENGGSCIESNGSHYCVCKEDYFGKKCEAKVSAKTCSNGDTNKDLCAKLSKSGKCSFNFNFNEFPVPVYCPDSCGLCIIKSKPNNNNNNSNNSNNNNQACIDTQPNCAIWAKLGLCPKIKDTDAKLCRKSCGLCSV